MDLDDMKIPQFEVANPIKDTLKNGFLFLGLGVVSGIAATVIHNLSVRNTMISLNYELGEHFISEVKKHNP